MQLADYLRTAQRYYVVIAACVIAGLSLGALVTAFQRPMYVATARAFVSTASASSAYDLSQAGNYAQQIVSSYADVATTPKVLDPVRRELRLTRSVASLASSVEASAAPDTVIINITATDASPRLAAAIANAVLNELSAVVPELTTSQNSAAAVKVTTLADAVPALRPSSPSLPLNLGLGLVAGLALAGAAVAAREAVNTAVRSVEDVRRATGLPIVGQIPSNLNSKVHRPLVMVGNPGSDAHAESYRTLRANLGYVDLTSSSHVWLITSSLSGEGKTSTVVNLAVALAQAGSRVLVVDADLRRPRVANYLGIDGSLGLSDVIKGSVAFDVALQQGAVEGLSILPAGAVPPNPSELLQSVPARTLLQRLSNEYEYVLVDSPPALAVADATILSSDASGVLVVCGLNQVKWPQLSATMVELRQVGAPLIGAVVTRAPRGSGSRSYYSAYASEVDS